MSVKRSVTFSRAVELYARAANAHMGKRGVAREAPEPGFRPKHSNEVCWKHRTFAGEQTRTATQTGGNRWTDKWITSTNLFHRVDTEHLAVINTDNEREWREINGRAYLLCASCFEGRVGNDDMINTVKGGGRGRLRWKTRLVGNVDWVPLLEVRVPKPISEKFPVREEVL